MGDYLEWKQRTKAFDDAIEDTSIMLEKPYRTNEHDAMRRLNLILKNQVLILKALQ